MAKIILTTGGTGGHIFPALAVGAEIRKRNPQASLLFMGSSHGPEAGLTAKADIPFIGLPAHGLMGRGLKAIPAFFGLFRSFLEAARKLHAFKPDAIAGFGGYASVAPMAAAMLLGIPALIHEQNAIAGASNKFLARGASRVCVSLPDTRGFATSTEVTGNPVRSEIVRTGHARGGFGHGRLLVLGGSQGAHGINAFIKEILPALRNAGVEIKHQCGHRDLPELRRAYTESGYDPQCVTAFIEDMAGAYAWADLAFCRAGASTVAELCASGTPAILVPFPAAIHDHQTRNAQALIARGAALLAPEKSLDADKMVPILTELSKDGPELARMSQQALSLAKPGAAAAIVDQLEQISKSKMEL